MRYIQDQVCSKSVTAKDTAADDSATIARKIKIRPSMESRMPLPRVIDLAEQVRRDLETNFAGGQLEVARSALIILGDLTLKIASATPLDATDAQAPATLQ